MSLADWTRSDLDCLLMICRDVQMSPLHITAVLHFESSFSPRAMNAGSSATGLIQWMGDKQPDKSVLYFGRTREKFASLGVVGQLPYLRDRFAPYKNMLSTLGRVYAVVACPAVLAMRFGDDDPIYARADELLTTRPPWRASAVGNYRANPDWDPLRTGVVTLRSLGYCARGKFTSGAAEFYTKLTSQPCPWRLVDDELPSLGYSLDKTGIAAFQKRLGLTADGELGPQTRGAIASEIATREAWG